MSDKYKPTDYNVGCYTPSPATLSFLEKMKDPEFVRTIHLQAMAASDEKRPDEAKETGGKPLESDALRSSEGGESGENQGENLKGEQHKTSE